MLTSGDARGSLGLRDRLVVRYCATPMRGQFFTGLLFFVHALSAVGFFIFWARTRFWLPKYAHILAAIGLLVGLECLEAISKLGTTH
jgi:hypothetical protein